MDAAGVASAGLIRTVATNAPLLFAGSVSLTKPDNSRAIKRGIDQYQSYVKDLNEEAKKPSSKVMEALKAKDSDFAKCKSFVGQVDCYKACPSVDSSGEVSLTSVSWRANCS